MNLPLSAALHARIPWAAVATLLLAGCGSSDSPTVAAVPQSCRPGPTFGLVDYRPEEYHWQLGQCWDSVQTQAHIDAAYHYEATAAGRFPHPATVADTLPYFYIGEDLLPVAGDSVLPALYFTVNQNRLLGLRTPTVFYYPRAPDSTVVLARALRDFSARFGRLRQAEFRRQLLLQRRLTLVAGRCEEVYHLGTGPIEADGDTLDVNQAVFSYHIRLRR